jgi:hypothetical protein
MLLKVLLVSYFSFASVCGSLGSVLFRRTVGILHLVSYFVYKKSFIYIVTGRLSVGVGN